jgi:hypothetical protein
MKGQYVHTKGCVRTKAPTRRWLTTLRNLTADE